MIKDSKDPYFSKIFLPKDISEVYSSKKRMICISTVILTSTKGSKSVSFDLVEVEETIVSFEVSSRTLINKMK